MKNRILIMLLACLFGIGGIAFANYSVNGGIEVPVVAKTFLVSTVTIPAKYVDANGDFILPMEATLTLAGSKKALKLKVTNEIQLSSNLSGTYILRVTIGDWHVERYLLFK